MPTTMNGLPYELFSAILEEAAKLNIKHNSSYTYGLSQAPEPFQDVRMQRVVRGHVPPDTRRWNATEAIRRVNRQCHDWASEYALKDLYITRWRGSERWMQSRNLDTMQHNPSSIAVYRDPYYSLRKTFELFANNPASASCVRRIWFDGYYGAHTNSIIFGILRRCINLDYLTLPWTALRYGNEEDWSRILGRNEQCHSISSLELLSIELKQSQTEKLDRKPLNFPRVSFSALKRLKIFGHSNFMALTDDDLISISHTAVQLKEIHITGTASVTIEGICALIKSSDKTLEILEHSPLVVDGFRHQDPASLLGHTNHFCPKILRLPRLQNLSLSLPSICEDLFADPSVKWSGEMQIRISTVCGRQPTSLQNPEKAQTQFWRILDQARSLMNLRKQQSEELDIEIFIENLIFEPRRFQVHGNFDLAEVVSDGAWPSEKMPSSKGPYGSTGLYGKDEGPYVSVSEEVFMQGLRKGYVSF